MTLKLLFIVVVVAQTLAPVPAHVRVSVYVCAFWGLHENAMGASDILRQKEHNLRRHLNLIFYLTIPSPSLAITIIYEGMQFLETLSKLSLRMDVTS